MLEVLIAFINFFLCVRECAGVMITFRGVCIFLKRRRLLATLTQVGATITSYFVPLRNTQVHAKYEQYATCVCACVVYLLMVYNDI